MDIPWSYSRLSDFESCALLFREKYISKTIQFVPNKHTERGSDIHKQLERNVVRAGTDQSPVGTKEVLEAHPIIRAFVQKHPQIFVEQKLGFTKRMKPTGFFDSNVWLRSVIDLTGLTTASRSEVGSVSILDWKTGQFKPNDDQVTLYNMCALCNWPSAECSTAALVFVDHKKSSKPIRHTRADLPDLIDLYSDRAEAIQIAAEKDSWPPTRNWKCKWCGVESCSYAGR